MITDRAAAGNRNPLARCFLGMHRISDLQNGSGLALMLVNVGRLEEARRLLDKLRERLPTRRSVKNFRHLAVYHATDAALCLFEGDIDAAMKSPAKERNFFRRSGSSPRFQEILSAVVRWILSCIRPSMA